MLDESFNIVEVFIAAANAHPANAALIHGKQSISYNDLLRDVQGTAIAFRSKGICPGDKVLVFVPMSLDLYRIVLALFYLGASPVFLDAWTSFRRLRECCEVVPCQAIIAPPKLLWMAYLIRSLRSIPIKIRSSCNAKPASYLPLYKTNPQQTALVTFTTGSTGIPKAADRTHAYLKAQLAALTPLIPADAAVLFSSLPIVVLINLALGKTTVLPPREYKIKKPATALVIAEAIRLNQVAALIVSPSVVEQLLLYPLPQLRHIITGGGPVFPRLAAQVCQQFPHAATTIVFGSTEAEPISHITAEYLQQVYQSSGGFGLPVGFPDEHAYVAILPFNYQIAPNGHTANEWRALLCQTEEVGEIVVSGDHVLQHYINNPAAEAFHKIKVDHKVWHRTGDAGRLDASGMLYFLGRCNEVITIGDQLIFPAIVTNQFCELTQVKAAALLVIDHELKLILAREKRVENGLLSKVLDACGIPTAKVIYLKEIPRDPRHQAKINYEELRKLLGSS